MGRAWRLLCISGSSCPVRLLSKSKVLDGENGKLDSKLETNAGSNTQSATEAPGCTAVPSLFGMFCLYTATWSTSRPT